MRIIRNHRPFFMLLLICLMIILPRAPSSSAQYASSWEPYDRVPGYSDDTVTPILVTDQDKAVHAFASQWVGEQDPRLAIIYSKWTQDGGWTAPVDILTNQAQNHMLGAYLDKAGVIHIIYFGGFGIMGMAGNIYYSRAPAVNADQVRSWSEPEVIGENAVVPPGTSAAIAGDINGKMVVIFNGTSAGSGVYAVYSYDEGHSWSNPVPIFLTGNPIYTPYSFHLSLGNSGWLHAIWNIFDEGGNDVALFYTRMDIRTKEWSKPIELAIKYETVNSFGPGHPIVVENSDYVVILYNATTPSSNNRPTPVFLLSKDGGQNWIGPYTPFPRLVGRSGFHALVVDSKNVIHALFNQRYEINVNGQYQTISGIFHTEFTGPHWTEPQVILNPGNYSPYDVRAVVSQGNVLLVTWREDPGAGQNGVWYSFTTLDAPQLPVVPLPVPTVELQATPTMVELPSAPTATLLPTPDIKAIQDIPPTDTSSFGPATAVIIGAVPVILLILMIILKRKARL